MLVCGMEVVVVSAEHVGGTRGSAIVSSTADVLGMSVVHGMRGFDFITTIYTPKT